MTFNTNSISEAQIESFTPIAKKLSLADTFRKHEAERKQAISRDLSRMLNLLPVNRFDELIYALRQNPINLVNDNDVVIYISGIFIQSLGWIFETTSDRNNIVYLSNITTDSQLVIMDHLELILES